MWSVFESKSVLKVVVVSTWIYIAFSRNIFSEIKKIKSFNIYVNLRDSFYNLTWPHKSSHFGTNMYDFNTRVTPTSVCHPG